MKVKKPPVPIIRQFHLQFHTVKYHCSLKSACLSSARSASRVCSFLLPIWILNEATPTLCYLRYAAWICCIMISTWCSSLCWTWNNVKFGSQTYQTTRGNYQLVMSNISLPNSYHIGAGTAGGQGGTGPPDFGSLTTIMDLYSNNMVAYA